MPTIHVVTEMNAPIQRCFDLARSIDLHMVSTEGSKEKAIAGRTTGLVVSGDTVTWQATHLGFRQKLTSAIPIVTPYTYFADEQIEGIFKRFHHDHYFEEKEGKTIMTDKFDYTAPLGILGQLASWLFLYRYMKKFLIKRNAVIKEFAETDQWKKVLHEN